MTTAQTQARPRGAARREALLEAVLTVVADVGADAVTHRRVAEVAGLPLASTTYWFADKEELLTAALSLAADRDVARLRKLAATADGIAGMVDLVLEPVDEPAGRTALMAGYALLLEAARRPALRDVARRWTDAYVETLGAQLERLGSRAPADDARLLLAAADGLLLGQLATGVDGDPRAALGRLAAALLEAS